MRKVFLSMMLLQPAKETQYVSEDFELGEAHYLFPMSYIIANNVEADEEILLVTGVEKGTEDVHTSVDNYVKFKNEVEKIVSAKNAKVSFVELDTKKDFNSLTFNTFFKNVAEQIHEGDTIFVDITFGMKPYSFSMFIALAYVVKACKNVELDTMIYAQKYTGSQIAKDTNESMIYDLTGLFYLNQIAKQAENGDRAALDGVLNFIINEE